MAKLNMKRIEILALIEDSKDIIDLLQRRGVIEITDYAHDAPLNKLMTGQSLSVFEKSLSAAQSAGAVLDTYAPQKKSLLNSVAGRKQISLSEFLEKTEKADTILRKAYEINALSKKIADEKSAAVHTETIMDALKPWLNLDVPIGYKGTAETKALAGTLPAFYTNESLTDALLENAGEQLPVTLEVVSATKEQTCVFILCANDASSKVEQAVRELGFIHISENKKMVPKEQYAVYEATQAEHSKETEKAITEINKLAKYREDLEFVIDYFVLRIDKYESLAKIGLSKNIFVLQGFAPEDAAVCISKELEKKFAAAVSIVQPGEEEDPPVLLKNNAFASPVESVTEMYSLPSNTDVDPNPIMSFFYYLFFGLMLSDGGYGLIMTIAMLVVKKKVSLEEKTKRTVNFFLYCGISTIFWGAMFGSWFGDIFQVVGREFFGKEIPSLAIWFEPVKDPMKLLLFSFLFGIIHLFIGLGIRFSMLWKLGQKLDAVFDVIPVYLLVLGVAPMGAGIILDVPEIFSAVGRYLALAGAAFIVLTSGRSAKNIFGKLGGGLYGLYNAGSGYLGDILSYSRLLALGLSTGVIASVVNVLGTISSNMVVKGFMLVFVFIFGHAVNIAVNLIGSYVHTNRLQYVEFFSKFYEGGGRAFTPLKVNTKYYRFKEETVDA